MMMNKGKISSEAVGWRAFSLLLLCATVLMSGCIVNLNLPSGSSSGGLIQQTIRPAEGFGADGKILLVDISGVLGLSNSTGGFFPELDTLTLITETMKLAAEDEDIEAVVVRIDTPGGGVTTSDLLYRAIKDFKAERPDVPVHASMLNMAASGGYYVAMAADEVSAHPTTVTGSIGVIAQFPYVGRLTDMIGVEMRTIKSGALKDTGSLFEKFSDEEKKVLQEMIDEFYETFLGVVAEGRPEMKPERLRELADGRIYTGKQAKELGLIDRIEYLPELIERIEEANGGSMSIVSYDPSFNRGSSLYAAARPPVANGAANGGGAINGTGTGSIPSQISVNHQVDLPGRLPAGFYYLWAEGQY